jgi:1-acyl-sn-glycerol-3-phosphate acyltransferase
MGLLRNGDMLLVFPEGTRNRHGKARPQLGAARLALESGAAFVPVSIAGSDRIKLFPPRFPRIRVYYGEPLALDDLPADDLRRASHAATKRWSEALEAGLAILARKRD